MIKLNIKFQQVTRHSTVHQSLAAFSWAAPAVTSAELLTLVSVKPSARGTATTADSLNAYSPVKLLAVHVVVWLTAEPAPWHAY